MMNELNPYQSPSTPVGPWEGHSELESVFPEAIQSLAQTKPWVRFISVLGFLVFGFSIVGLLFVLGFAGGFMMFFMLPFAVLFYFIPSLLLWNYASRIRRLLNDRSSHSLVSAVSAQKSFWKYIGISVTIVLVFYVVMLLLAGVTATL